MGTMTSYNLTEFSQMKEKLLKPKNAQFLDYSVRETTQSDREISIEEESVQEESPAVEEIIDPKEDVE